jgi:hypothetical protein
MVDDTARSESLAHDLNKRYPLGTQMQALWLPTIHARLALNGDKKNPASDINALQSASAIESGLIPFFNNISCLSSVYVRGEAYLAAGQGSAAAEFRKILDHAAWCGTVGQEHWRIGKLLAPALCKQSPHRARMPTPPAYENLHPTKLPHPLEGRRSRHPHSERSQGGVRKAAVGKQCMSVLYREDLVSVETRWRPRAESNRRPTVFEQFATC